MAWRETNLGKEIELAYGKSLPAQKRDAGGIPVFGSNGQVGKHSSGLVSGPGIVVGRKGSVGKVVFSETDFWPIDTTYFIKNNGNHDWRYLFYLLSSQGLDLLNSHSAVPGLNREDVYSIDVCLPDKPEQQSISASLDAVYSSVQAETRVAEILSELKQATMRELFTRGLKGEAQRGTEVGPIPESWGVESLGQNFDVGSGGTPRRSVPDYWIDGVIPWAKTTEINYQTITKTEEHITRAGLENSAVKLYPAGTLLMAMYGQGVTRGRVAFLGIDATCNQACAAIQSKTGRIDSTFLFYFLTYQYESIRQMAHGGQQQNLNADLVRSIQVAFPPDVEDQSQIVEILSAIDAKIDLHKRKKAVLEGLFKSLLHKLMTGEVRVTDLDLSALKQEPEVAA